MEFLSATFIIILAINRLVSSESKCQWHRAKVVKYELRNLNYLKELIEK